MLPLLPALNSSLRTALATLLALAVLCAGPALGADAYPAKPVRIVVPFAPGGGTDIIGRIVGQKLSVILKQQFLIENRSGAGGSIGTDAVAKAAPDGYTLLLVPTSHVINPAIYAHLPFNTERDFAPISMLAAAPILLAVHSSVPASNLKELVALAKASPAAVANYGSAGNGTVFHLACEQFQRMAGFHAQHIAYKGGGPTVQALAGNEVPMAFETMLALQPHVKSGRVKALAVLSALRSKTMPEVATAVEQGYPKLVADNDYMLFAPAGTPAPVLALLYASTRAALKEPGVASTLTAQGNEIIGGSPQELAKYVRAESRRWSEIVSQAGIKAD
jgi:tripartite-type tricarboxylate transporter receptor subunit TctC